MAIACGVTLVPSKGTLNGDSTSVEASMIFSTGTGLVVVACKGLETNARNLRPLGWLPVFVLGAE